MYWYNNFYNLTITTLLLLFFIISKLTPTSFIILLYRVQIFIRRSINIFFSILFILIRNKFHIIKSNLILTQIILFQQRINITIPIFLQIFLRFDFNKFLFQLYIHIHIKSFFGIQLFSLLNFLIILIFLLLLLVIFSLFLFSWN